MKVTLVLGEDGKWRRVSVFERIRAWHNRTFPPGCIYTGPLPFGFYCGEPPKRRIKK